jgi:hypothetical protein
MVYLEKVVPVPVASIPQCYCKPNHTLGPNFSQSLLRLLSSCFISKKSYLQIINKCLASSLLTEHIFTIRIEPV